MSDTLRTGLEKIDANCEAAAKTEVEKLVDDSSDDQNARMPSPQAVEAIWLRLISRKEHEFIEEIRRVLQLKAPASASKADGEQLSAIEALIESMLADDRYVDRMQYFFEEAARNATEDATFSHTQAKRLELIDATYRTGVRDVLRRARQHTLRELNLYKHAGAPGEEADFMSTWKRYSTLSPWRSIGTIILLSLTSYLIAFVIASDTFRALLEQFGFSTGTGL